MSPSTLDGCGANHGLADVLPGDPLAQKLAEMIAGCTKSRPLPSHLKSIGYLESQQQPARFSQPGLRLCKPVY